MSTGPEGSPPDESKSKEVFDVFDRASSHRPDTSFDYFIGDGLVVRVGWVNSDGERPFNLTLDLRDEKCHRGIMLSVGAENSRYERQTAPSNVLDWLKWGAEQRRRARQQLRRETFTIPTAALEPVARAVSLTEHGRPAGSVLWEAANEVSPLPDTDVDPIRVLIKEFSEFLD